MANRSHHGGMLVLVVMVAACGSLWKMGTNLKLPQAFKVPGRKLLGPPPRACRKASTTLEAMKNSEPKPSGMPTLKTAVPWMPQATVEPEIAKENLMKGALAGSVLTFAAAVVGTLVSPNGPRTSVDTDVMLVPETTSSKLEITRPTAVEYEVQKFDSRRPVMVFQTEGPVQPKNKLDDGLQKSEAPTGLSTPVEVFRAKDALSEDTAQTETRSTPITAVPATKVTQQESDSVKTEFTGPGRVAFKVFSRNNAT